MSLYNETSLTYKRIKPHRIKRAVLEIGAVTGMVILAFFAGRWTERELIHTATGETVTRLQTVLWGTTIIAEYEIRENKYNEAEATMMFPQWMAWASEDLANFLEFLERQDERDPNTRDI